MKTVDNAKELGKAIKDKESTIIVEGDLSKKIIRIKAAGPVAWGICIGCIGIAITAILSMPAETVAGPATLGTSTVMHFTAIPVAAAPAAITLGSAVGPAIAIGVAAGGVGALTALRDKYKIAKKGQNYVELKRK